MLFIPDKITIFPPPLSFSSFFTISFIFYELTKPANLFLAFIQSLSLSLSLFIFALRVFHRSERTTKDSNTIIFNWMDSGAISVLSDINPDVKPT